ncbi:MAG: hypothetical protein ABIV94_10010 [Acidimicrobiales bacterium]
MLPTTAAVETEASPTLTVRPWPDEVIDRVGHDPRSAYVERFWLPLLGPSSVVLLRRLAHELDDQPAEVCLPLEPTARSLGLGIRGGRGSTFVKTLERCRQFQLVHVEADGRTVLARRKLPPLNRGQVGRLPEPVRADHDRWIRSELVAATTGDQERRRARLLALSLFELGEQPEDVERRLLRWRFVPLLAKEATAWSGARHRAASAAASVDPPPDAAA